MNRAPDRPATICEVPHHHATSSARTHRRGRRRAGTARAATTASVAGALLLALASGCGSASSGPVDGSTLDLGDAGSALDGPGGADGGAASPRLLALSRDGHVASL